MTSVLNKPYYPPTRPYSQKELGQLKNKTMEKLKVGNIQSTHKDCKHFYNVKLGGRKEKDMLENNKKVSGSCSVCWKLQNTPKDLLNSALDLVDEYNFKFEDPPTYYTYENMSLETTFYKWLYGKN